VSKFGGEESYIVYDAPPWPLPPPAAGFERKVLEVTWRIADWGHAVGPGRAGPWEIQIATDSLTNYLLYRLKKRARNAKTELHSYTELHNTHQHYIELPIHCSAIIGSLSLGIHCSAMIGSTSLSPLRSGSLLR